MDNNVTTMADPNMLWEGKIVPRTFSVTFVILSFVVSFIGSASTLDLFHRRTSHRGTFNILLLVGSAVSMGGIAIWSMHYIGNRAIILANGEPELQIQYSNAFTVLSFFMPILVLMAAFFALGSSDRVSKWRVAVGGLLAGAAICGMHYIGNSSISNYVCIYTTANVVGAALISVLASTVALSMFFVFRAAWASSRWKRLASPIVLACAVSGMHWCASVGTNYRFLTLTGSSSDSSRYMTLIVVICLSVAACVVMAAMAAYSARARRRYAKNAQQVVLAAAIFDKQGRILVNPDGLLPSEKITDTFLEKNIGDGFNTAHPLFQWMFRVSRQWTIVNHIMRLMNDHLASLPRAGRDRTGRLTIKLINDFGEMIENYNTIFKELFCVAAQSLAERTKSELIHVGSLWDEILPTGSSPERRVRHINKRATATNRDSVVANATASAPDRPVTGDGSLAEKGMKAQQVVSRGSLMFLVRHVSEDKDIDKLAAAGYRFAEVAQVASIISSSMQILSNDVTGKLREMANYVEEPSLIQGVRLGVFAVRARVGGSGFDVLVNSQYRNALPSEPLPIEGLESWQLTFLTRLDRVSVGNLLVPGTIAISRPEEHAFLSQIRDTVRKLEKLIDDSLFADAVLVAQPVAFPVRESATTPKVVGMTTNVFIALRLVVPIHAKLRSPSCQFIPLSLLQTYQLASAAPASQLAFARAVHVELSPIINATAQKPSLKATATSSSPKPKSAFWAFLGKLGVMRMLLPRPSSAHLKFTDSPSTAFAWRKSSYPSPAAGGFSTTDTRQPKSASSTWGDDGAPSLDTDPDTDADKTAGTPKQASTFGGIMVSQEVTVHVEDATTSPWNTSLATDRTRRAHPSRRSTDSICPSSVNSSAEGATVMAALPRQFSRRSSVAALHSTGDLKSVTVGGPAGLVGIHSAVSQAATGEGAEGATFVEQLFSVCITTR